MDPNDLLNTNTYISLDDMNNETNNETYQDINIDNNYKFKYDGKPYLSKEMQDKNEEKYSKLLKTIISIDSRNRINGEIYNYKINFNKEFRYIYKIRIRKAHIPKFDINKYHIQGIQYVFLYLYTEGEDNIKFNGNIINTYKDCNNEYFAKIPLSQYNEFYEIDMEYIFNNNYLNKLKDIYIHFFDYQNCPIMNMVDHTFELEIYEVINILKQTGLDSRTNNYDKLNII